MSCLIGRLRGMTVILGRCSDEIQFGQFRAACEQTQKLSVAPPALVLALVVSPGLKPWATFWRASCAIRGSLVALPAALMSGGSPISQIAAGMSEGLMRPVAGVARALGLTRRQRYCRRVRASAP